MSDLELLPDYPVLTGIGKLSGSFKLDTLPGGVTYSDITIRAYYMDPLGGRFNGIQVAQVNCQSTGQWLIEDISEYQRYNVVISIPGYNDIIYSNKVTSDAKEIPPPLDLVDEAFVWYYSVSTSSEGIDEGQYVVVRHIPSGIEHEIKISGIIAWNAESGTSRVAISPDGKYVAAYQGASYSKIILVYVATGYQRFVELSGDGILGLTQSARPSLQFSGGTLYALTEDGLFNIDLITGKAHPIHLGHIPDPEGTAMQSMSVSGSLMALTHNIQMAGTPPGTPPVLLYNTDGLLLPEQFPLPAGAQLTTEEIPRHSPKGTVGMFSPNGLYYAMAVKMVFGEAIEKGADEVHLVIYDVESRAALHDVVLSDRTGNSYNVAWSKDSRFVVTTVDNSYSTEHAGSVFDLQTETLVEFGDEKIGNQPAVVTNSGVVLYYDGGWRFGIGDMYAASVDDGQLIELPEWASMPDVTSSLYGIAST